MLYTVQNSFTSQQRQVQYTYSATVVYTVNPSIPHQSLLPHHVMHISENYLVSKEIPPQISPN